MGDWGPGPISTRLLTFVRLAMTVTSLRVFAGFLSAAIAVLTVHQGLVFLLDASGLISRQAWSLAPHGPLQVPSLLNAVFWGGLWGSVLALVYDIVPGRAAAIKGLVFGWMIYLFSNNLILPILKGTPLFYGGDLNQLLAVFVILSGFGATTAIIYNAAFGDRAGAA
jgi:hypothetical protein